MGDDGARRVLPGPGRPARRTSMGRFLPALAASATRRAPHPVRDWIPMPHAGASRVRDRLKAAPLLGFRPKKDCF